MFRKNLKEYISKETFLFLMVIFTNLSIGGVGVSQFIYGILSVVCLMKLHNYTIGTRPIFFFIYFLAFTLINYFLYLNFDAFGSSLRFVFNLFICVLFIQSFDNQHMRERIINGYIYATTIFSVFVIMQFISYYLFGFNIKFDFGDYTGMANEANDYDPVSGLFYRTGGLFREPSWFATFATPCVFLLTYLKKTKLLVICILGTLLSTSGVGLAVLFVYGLWLGLKRLNILQIALIILGIVILITPILFLMDHAISELNEENSRLQIYFFIYSNRMFSLFGINPEQLYYNGEFLFFMNSLSIIYLFWGFVGLLVFSKFIYFKRLPMLTIAIFAIIAIEGCYGRIDFWMMLLACKLFNSYLEALQRRQKLASSY